MAKASIVGIYGAAVSTVSAAAFWVVAIGTLGFSSGATDLEYDMRTLMPSLAALYTVGALIGLFSQLGAFLQFPSIAISLPALWYIGAPTQVYMVHVAGLVGASLLVFAMFIDYSRAERAFKAPPFSRFAIWRLDGSAPVARPLPKGAAKAALALLAACIVATGAFAAYCWSSGVSDLKIQFIVDGETYGSVNISVCIDGEEVYAGYLQYEPSESRETYVDIRCTVTAGTHLIEVDAWNGADLDEGTVDSRKEVRTLPFTTDQAYLGLGVAFT